MRKDLSNAGFSAYRSEEDLRPVARILAQEVPRPELSLVAQEDGKKARTKKAGGQSVEVADTAPQSVGKSPLILAPPEDLHAAAVSWGLRENGVRALWAQSLAEHSLGPISIRCDPVRGWCTRGRVPGESFTAVWFRRPQKPVRFARARTCDEPCLTREWSHFHENVYALYDEFGDTLWANCPASACLTENKLVQLHVARACGMLFPETLVSTDPEESVRFISQHGRVIYKSFRTYLWVDRTSGRSFTNWTRLIDSSTRLRADSLALCPGIFQRYVEKVSELRVTVIGNHQFVAQIRSSRGSELVDWRQSIATRRHQGAPSEIRASTAVLPAGWRAKIELMMRKLGIVFGCIDLAVDEKGDTYFLEVNQSGDFLFIEQMLESLPVLRAMCAMLAAGRVDYSLESMRNVSYQEYLRSDAHHEWLNGLEPEPAREIQSKWTMLE